MAVSANYSLEFNRDEIIRLAFQLAGLLDSYGSPDAYDTEMASDFFNLELQALQAEGVVLRTVERDTIDLIDGTASYVLDADTIDVQVGNNDQAGMLVPTSGNQTQVKVVSRDDYEAIPDKTTEGKPSLVYVEKAASVTLKFWPVPDDSTDDFAFYRVRLLRDMDTGTVTTDLARRWLKAITWALAGHLAMAKSMGLDRVQFLNNEGERLKAVCRADDVQRGRMRLRVAHNGRNW